MGNHLGPKGTDPVAMEYEVERGVGPASCVDDAGGNRLVHWHDRTGEPGDPGAIAQGVVDGRSEYERRVFDRVVLVDMEIAVRAHREVDHRVVRECGQEVIEHSDAGLHDRLPGSIEVDRDLGAGVGRDRRRQPAVHRALDGRLPRAGGKRRQRPESDQTREHLPHSENSRRALSAVERASADAVIEARGLKQITDSSAIEAIVDKVIAANPAQAEEYRAGKEKLIGFFVGKVMQASQGKANPGLVNQMLKEITLHVEL